MGRGDVVAELDFEKLPEQKKADLTSTKNLLLCEAHFTALQFLNPADKGKYKKHWLLQLLFCYICGCSQFHGCFPLLQWLSFAGVVCFDFHFLYSLFCSSVIMLRCYTVFRNRMEGFKYRRNWCLNTRVPTGLFIWKWTEILSIDFTLFMLTFMPLKFWMIFVCSCWKNAVLAVLHAMKR